MTNFPKLAADAGRIAANPDVSPGQLKMALFAVPHERSSETAVVLAASTCSPGWKRQHVDIHHAGRIQTVQTPRRKSVLGRAASVLGAEAGATVEVLLYDAEQWLVSCCDRDLELGDNLALLGREVIQFGEATSLGEGRFRLGCLLRGRVGTDAAISGHEEDEPFALIERSALQPIVLPVLGPGSPVRAVAQNGSAEFSLMIRSKR
jgi:hypothetical protein